MSKEENRSMIDAYQKMLEDGSAFKQVDMRMMDTPSLAEADGAFSMGERVERQPERQPEPERTPERDYSQYDSVMEQRINSLRNKIHGNSNSNSNRGGSNREIESLKKRIEKLEEALMLVMETHEKLLG